MSEYPKPKALVKPKSIGGDADMGSPAHDELLQWLWLNIEAILPRMFCVKDEWIAERRQAAIDKYLTRVRGTEAKLKEFSNKGEAKKVRLKDPEYDYAPHSEKLLLAAKRFEAHAARFSAPEIPVEKLLVSFMEKYFQYPLVTIKSAHTNRAMEEIVGFIDVQARMTRPCDLWLSDNSVAGFLWDIEPEKLCALQPCAPEWQVNTTTVKVYFDVRSELPASGVLVRELRTLHELIEEDALISVVVDSIPDTLRDILRHQGFFVLERSKFQDLPTV